MRHRNTFQIVFVTKVHINNAPLRYPSSHAFESFCIGNKIICDLYIPAEVPQKKNKYIHQLQKLEMANFAERIRRLGIVAFNATLAHSTCRRRPQNETQSLSGILVVSVYPGSTVPT